MAEGELTARTVVAPEPRQVRVVREWTRKTLAGWGLAEHSDVVELLVSELVTNAVRYGDPESAITVSLTLTDGPGCHDLWLEVRDGGGGKPMRRQADERQTRGRGLELLDGLLETYGGVWGVASHTPGVGKTVFAALPLPL